jgi:hypothetical protein
VTDWIRTRWRKLYLREPLEQQALPWAARGLRDLLIRLAEDDGYLGARETLVRALRAEDDPLVGDYLDSLLQDGFLVEQDGFLVVRNLPAAQGDGPPVDDPPPRPNRGQRAAQARWQNATEEQRKAATMAATKARRASRDRSSTHDATHVDARSMHVAMHVRRTVDARCDARSEPNVHPRAVSGQDQATESLLSQPEKPEKPDLHERARTYDARTTHDATHVEDARTTHVEEDESARISKPKTSPLTDDDLASLEVELMHDRAREFIAIVIKRWLSDPSREPDRFPEQWRKTAKEVVRSAWRNARRRQELLAALEDPDAREEAARRGQAAYEARERAIAAERAKAIEAERGAPQAAQAGPHKVVTFDPRSLVKNIGRIG